mgnify:CR=1 FL=1
MEQDFIDDVVEHIQNNPVASFKELAYDLDCQIEDLQQSIQESSYTYNEIVDQDPKYPQRVLGKIIGLLKEFKSKYDSHYEEVGKYDEAVLDYLHKAERLDLDDSEETGEFLQKLVPERKRRRTIKNQMWVGEPFYNFIQDLDLIEILNGVMSSTNRKVTQLENFKYNPKIYPELFDK